MPGDAALRLLIDIQARDSARAVLMSLAGAFPLLIGAFRMLGTAASLFATGNIKAGFIALKYSILGIGTALLQILALFTLVGGVIAIALGVAGVRAAANFQQGLNRLVTGAGDVTDNMQKMGQAILAISVDSGVLTNELLPAMYQIISAGQRGAQAENTLAVAAKGAVVEQANVVDVAKALTTAMTDYGTKLYNATQFMNGYTRATQLGKITLEQLSQTMGPILPYARQLGISFADVAAAMATMTNAGIPAARAATSLRFLFQSLENPTKKAETAMKEFGLSSVAVGNELKKSLPGALEMIYKAALKAGPEGSVPFNRAISDMIGGMRSMQAYLALTGTHLSTFEANVRAIATAMGMSKTQILGWDVAQGNFNVQLDRAKAAFQALLIVIGNRLLPILTNLLKNVTPLIVAFAQWFLKTDPLGKAMAWLATAFEKVKAGVAAAWPLLVYVYNVIANMLTPVVKLVGQVIMSVLVPAWNQFVAAVKPYLPMLLDLAKLLGVVLVAVIIIVGAVILGLIIIVLLLVAAFLWLVTTSIKVAAWLHSTWDNVTKAIAGFFRWLVGEAKSIWNNVMNAIKNAITAGVNWIKTAWNNAINWIKNTWNGLVSAAFQLGANFIHMILAGLQSAWNAVVSWVTGALAWLKGLWPHSPVKDGPLKGSENWGYNFGMNIADGIRRSIPAVQSASSMLASAVGGGYGGSYSMSYGGSRYPTGGSVIVNHITIMPPSIKLDGAEVTDKIMQRGITDIRRHGGPIKR